jgi:hypothetical protein
MAIRFRFDLRPSLDLGDPEVLRTAGRCAIVGSLAAAVTFMQLARGGAIFAALVSLAVFVVVWIAATALVLAMAGASAQSLVHFVAPRGSSTPTPDDFSREKSLLARGQVEAALSAIRVRLANHPADPALCVFAADAFARSGAQPAEGERLFLRARELKGVTPGQDYYATNRLIDLYLGVLNRPDRASEELQRLQRRHPGSDAAAHAARAQRRLARDASRR